MFLVPKFGLKAVTAIISIGNKQEKRKKLRGRTRK
jgi:hypothetical protein